MGLGQALLIPGLGGSENINDWSNYKTWTGQSITGTRRLLVPLSEDADIVAGAQRDGSDIRFWSSDGQTQLPFELVGRNQYIAPRGNWTWFSRPQAISKSDGSKMWTSFLTNDGFVVVAEYTAATGNYVYTRLRDTGFQIDDHANPSLFYRSDGKIFVAYVKHDQDDKVYYRVSSSADDTSSFAAEQNTVFTASSLMSYVQLQTIGTDLYLFTRRGPQPQEWCYKKSTDDGDTFTGTGTETVFWEPSYRGYLQSYSNGSRIDFFASGSPTDEIKEGFHFYFDGTDFFLSDGTNVTASLPLDETDLQGTASEVFTSATDYIWCNDVIYDGTIPHCLGVRYPNGSEDDHRLMYFSYDNVADEWDQLEVLTEGNGIGTTDSGSSQARYNGGARFQKDDATKLWVARDPVGTALPGLGVYEIEEWTITAKTSAAKTRTITSGSFHKNFHPQPVIGGDVDDFEVVWCGYGPYIGFEGPLDEFQSGIQGYPGRRTWDLAYVKSDDPEVVVSYGRTGVSSKSNPTAVWGGDYVFVLHGGWQRGQRLDRLSPSIGPIGTPQLKTYWIGSSVNNRLPLLNTDFTGEFSLTASRENIEWWDFGTSLDLSGWTAASALVWGGYTALLSNEHYPLSIGAQTTAGAWLRAIAGATDDFETKWTTDDSAEGGDTGLTVVDDDTNYMMYSEFNGSNVDARVNKTAGTPIATTGTVLDATASRELEVANYSPDNNAGWEGEVGGILIPNQAVISKAETDDIYDMVTNSAWGAFGTEKTTPFSDAFTETDLDNIELFLDADSISQGDDTDLSPWTSIDDGTYNFTNGTASERPHYRTGGINSQPAVQFTSAASQHLLCSDAGLLAALNANSGAGSLAIVCRFHTSLGSGSEFFFGATRDAVNNKYLYINKTATTHDLRFSYVNSTAGTHAVCDDEVLAIDTTYIIIVRSDGTSYSIRANGVEEAFTSSDPTEDGSWFGDIGLLTHFALGALYRSSGDSNHSNVLLAKGLYCSDEWTAAEVADLEALWADQYGVTLP